MHANDHQKVEDDKSEADPIGPIHLIRVVGRKEMNSFQNHFFGGPFTRLLPNRLNIE